MFTLTLFTVKSFFLIDTFIQQGCIKLVEGNGKDIYNVIKDFVFQNKLFFRTF